jgi:hypothetical protein
VKKQVKKEGYVIFGIKERTLIKKKSHSVHPVGAGIQRQAVYLSTADQHYLVTCLYQCLACSVNPLIGSKVVGDGNNGGWQGTYELRITNYEARSTKYEVCFVFQDNKISFFHQTFGEFV